MAEKELYNLFSLITEELIYKLCSVADENNYDRDSFIEAFADLFKVISETSTFEKYIIVKKGSENNG